MHFLMWAILAASLALNLYFLIAQACERSDRDEDVFGPSTDDGQGFMEKALTKSGIVPRT